LKGAVGHSTLENIEPDEDDEEGNNSARLSNFNTIKNDNSKSLNLHGITSSSRLNQTK